MLAQNKTKVITISAIIIALIGIITFFAFHKKAVVVPVVEPIVTTDTQPKHEVIGKSVEGRNIEAYTYGNGTTTILFAGGMHGGYEWNSVLLAYQFMDYLKENLDSIPSNISVTVIPAINPDGVYKVIGKEGRFAMSDVPKTTPQAQSVGRFNANDVDLNRNFDCNWKPKSTWQSKIVSAGTSPFSEPEAQAIRDFVLKNKPVAAIFWHSQANAVYASECNDGVLPDTLSIMTAYAKAAKYPAVKSFDAYPVTGDSEGWLASINIPAITVELQTHETVEWDRNLAGIKAIFNYYR
jgi:predicted deacylase